MTEGVARTPAVEQKLRALELPLIAAPMFLVSKPELVSAACRSGVVGAFPALNQRSTEGYEEWLESIESVLEQHADENIAPHAVNLIVHRTNPRLAADLEVTIRHRVPVVITSLGAAPDIVERIQAYGGIVLHDVTNPHHARKALDAGVDGLVAVSAGAGGHAGAQNPLTLVAELRQMTDKLIVMAGGISHGGQIAAALAAGADLAYAGTRFIATRESAAADAYKRMLVDSAAEDIVYTPRISGIHANFLAPSIRDNGIDLEQLENHGAVDLGEEMDHGKLAWKHIWSAGHGVGSIHDVPSTAELCDRLRDEFCQALSRLDQRYRDSRLSARARASAADRLDTPSLV